MPRTARLLEDGCLYHIVTRGNNRKMIFRNGKDYRYFYNTVRKYLVKHKILIYHYCFMSNHVHLLIKSVDSKKTSKFFQGIFQVYSNYFCRRYQHIGHLYQSRYKSYPIDKESYLLDCGRYIERNPLRANIVKNIEEYQWSSYLYYVENRKDDIITEPSPGYVQLAEETVDRQRCYKERILEDRPYDFILDRRFKI